MSSTLDDLVAADPPARKSTQPASKKKPNPRPPAKSSAASAASPPGQPDVAEFFTEPPDGGGPDEEVVTEGDRRRWKKDFQNQVILIHDTGKRWIKIEGQKDDRWDLSAEELDDWGDKAVPVMEKSKLARRLFGGDIWVSFFLTSWSIENDHALAVLKDAGIVKPVTLRRDGSTGDEEPESSGDDELDRIRRMAESEYLD